jgi:hypothetical protein
MPVALYTNECGCQNWSVSRINESQFLNCQVHSPVSLVSEVAKVDLDTFHTSALPECKQHALATMHLEENSYVPVG